MLYLLQSTVRLGGAPPVYCQARRGSVFGHCSCFAYLSTFDVWANLAPVLGLGGAVTLPLLQYALILPYGLLYLRYYGMFVCTVLYVR